MRDATPAAEPAGETLDLGLALRTLGASARWIVLGVVVGAIAGVAAGFLLVRYQSEGVFALGAVTAREVGPNPPPYPRTLFMIGIVRTVDKVCARRGLTASGLSG